MANEDSIPAATGLDDLFDYDVGLDDILQEGPNRSNENAPKPSAAPDNSGLVLGLDEEVKVAKKRQPVAKLDEPRLLSQAGIPKLRHNTKRKLKFKGKGHEFSDLARLLNFYQLWLDDLYPRAKFADGLTIIEKLGHSKRLQTMRREWIEEEKPRLQHDNLPDVSQINQETSVDNTPMPDASGTQRSQLALNTNTPEDDELFIPDEDNRNPCIEGRDLPEDDELDALLREQENEDGLKGSYSISEDPNISRNIDEFADDLEVMDELDVLGELVS